MKGTCYIQIYHEKVKGLEKGRVQEDIITFFKHVILYASEVCMIDSRSKDLLSCKLVKIYNIAT